ncbi:MAG: NAD(P)/FAD-dependent oxidoreductase [Solirubrobacteraceae bacterium]|jgi:cation diffusion facilitator CzcD-associated flavoprotein CzcO|nr:NAD(P)/FAD-dependent oxidoreductase [Solirubrobacteraceae bacterium]
MAAPGPRTTPEIAIVGAGMSGVLLGIRLREAGIESFTIYEKGEEIGGTWRDNTYPGLACDIPSRFYSYSFAPNPEWTRLYSPGPEIQDYLLKITDRYGMREHIRFGIEIADVRFDEQRERWQITTTSGERTDADLVVCATGLLHHPRYPQIEGLETFAGACFHSARWDHEVPLDGRRIGIIGTGSTGVQLTSDLAYRAGRLDLFARTPQWVFPAPNPEYPRPLRALLQRFAGLNRPGYWFWGRFMKYGIGRAVVEEGPQRRLADRMCRWNLSRVKDPELRAKLTPQDQPMCKRMIVSPRYYDAVQQPCVDVITERIERVEPQGVRTADGVLHELDVLVLATGFDAHAYIKPIELTGPGGRTLDEAWADGVRAYRTVGVAGFPNLFFMLGPHSPVGNQSLIRVAEDQASYIVQWARRIRDGEVLRAAPTQEATDAYNDAMRAQMPQTAWLSGCQSWYLGKDGFPELWPWRPERHEEMLAEPDLSEFDVVAPGR